MYATVHWASHFLQGNRNTQPCLTGHPVAYLSISLTASLFSLASATVRSYRNFRRSDNSLEIPTSATVNNSTAFQRIYIVNITIHCIFFIFNIVFKYLFQAIPIRYVSRLHLILKAAFCIIYIQELQ